MSTQTNTKLLPMFSIPVIPYEREHFLVENSMPVNDTEGYIWFAFDNFKNVAQLFVDEAETAASMAERAGLEALAARIREGAKV